MSDINYCELKIPEFSIKTKLDGFYTISNELNIGIFFDKTDENFEKLFSFIEWNDSFTVQIKSELKGDITGFGCICLTPFIPTAYDIKNPVYKNEPLGTKEFLKIKSNLWIERFSVLSINTPIWESIRLTFPYSTPWFDIVAPITLYFEKCKIIFDCTTQESWTSFPSAYSKSKIGLITIDTEDSISLDHVLNIAIMIQALIRYMSDIAFPMGEIELYTKGKRGTAYLKGQFGLEGINSIPSVKAYLKMPHTLSSLSQQGLTEWAKNWKKLSVPILNFENTWNKSIDKQITEYIKSFDTIYSFFIEKTLCAPSIEDFENWKIKITDYIMNDNPFNFSRERIYSLIDNLKYKDSLTKNIISTMTRNLSKIKPIKSEKDIKEITKYFKGMRNSDAHPSEFDIFKLPNKYNIFDMQYIAKKIVECIIDEQILGYK